MVFSDTSSAKAGLLQDCERDLFGENYGSITDNSTLLASFTNKLNRSLERVTGLIRLAEGRWQWDDSNQTDFPYATTSLVANQQDYSLDATTHFKIERVEVQDTAGAWTKLMPFDKKDLGELPLSDFLTSAGIPQYYDKVGNSLLLYPKPSYSQSASLKIFFERGPSYFATTDTTKVPGFNPLFHRLLSLDASYEHASRNNLEVKKDLAAEIQRMEDALFDFYSQRDKDEHIRLTAQRHNFR